MSARTWQTTLVFVFVEHGMQETLLTLTDHLWEASPSSPEPSLLCLLSVSPRDIRVVTHSGCGHHHIVTSAMSRVTHSYLDQGEIEKVVAELNWIISINDLLCSGYVMEHGTVIERVVFCFINVNTIRNGSHFGLGSTILKQSRVLAGSLVSSVCGVKGGRVASVQPRLIYSRL